MSEKQSEDHVVKTVNINEILSTISELNKSNIISVYVPSLNDDINFKPLTVKQQKMILSTGVDTEIENLSFANAMNDIILENCLSRKDEIKTIDKSIILLQLRQKAVGDIVTVVEDETEYKISIDDQVKRVKATDPVKSDFKVNTSGVEIAGKIPGLVVDTKYNKLFTKTQKKHSKNNKIQLTDLVGDIFVHEMVKYVNTVSINGNVIDLQSGVELGQVIHLFESLPMSISLKVAEEIKNLRTVEIASLTSDSLPDDVQISIDASLFTSE